MKLLVAILTFVLPFLITLLIIVRRTAKEKRLRAAANARLEEQLRWLYGEKSRAGRKRFDESQYRKQHGAKEL